MFGFKLGITREFNNNTSQQTAMRRVAVVDPWPSRIDFNEGKNLPPTGQIIANSEASDRRADEVAGRIFKPD